MDRIFLAGLALIVLAGCGQATNSLYCTGGTGANPFPGVGYLQSQDAACTGTLISPHVVMTAGHCVFNEPVNSLQFTLNPSPLNSNQVAFATAVQVSFDPQFNPAGLNNNSGSDNPGADVAMILLGSTNYGQPPTGYLTFGTDSLLNNSAQAAQVGYGDQANGATGIEDVKLVLFSGFMPLQTPQGNIQNGILQTVRGPQGTIGCSGDSGSPLLWNTNGVTSIVGVYSTGEDTPGESDLQECQSGTQAGDYIAVDVFRGYVESVRQQWDGVASGNCN